MSTRINQLAGRALQAHERTAEIVQKHASPERAELIAKLGAGPEGYGIGHDPMRVQVMHAEMLAALAEIVEGMASGRSSGQKKPPAKE